MSRVTLQCLCSAGAVLCSKGICNWSSHLKRDLLFSCHGPSPLGVRDTQTTVRRWRVGGRHVHLETYPFGEAKRTELCPFGFAVSRPPLHLPCSSMFASTVAGPWWNLRCVDWSLTCLSPIRGSGVDGV